MIEILLFFATVTREQILKFKNIPYDEIDIVIIINLSSQTNKKNFSHKERINNPNKLSTKLTKNKSDEEYIVQ